MIFFGIAILIGVGYYYFNKRAIIKRKLQKASHKTIKSFKDNEIGKFTGNIKLIIEPYFAPLSNRICAYYHVIVEEKKSDSWETIIEEETSLAHEFLIRDGDYYAYITDYNIKHHIIKDRNYSSGTFNNATTNLKKILNKYGYESEGALGFNKNIQYEEGVLEVDEEVAVFGKGVWKDAIELNLPEKYGQVLEITSTDKGPIYISDDPSTTKKTVKKEAKKTIIKTVKRKNSKKKYNQEEKKYRK